MLGQRRAQKLRIFYSAYTTFVMKQENRFVLKLLSLYCRAHGYVGSKYIGYHIVILCFSFCPFRL